MRILLTHKKYDRKNAVVRNSRTNNLPPLASCLLHSLRGHMQPGSFDPELATSTLSLRRSSRKEVAHSVMRFSGLAFQDFPAFFPASFWLSLPLTKTLSWQSLSLFHSQKSRRLSEKEQEKESKSTSLSIMNISHAARLACLVADLTHLTAYLHARADSPGCIA